MKGDQMGTDPTNPSPRELPLSNQTRFNWRNQQFLRSVLPHNAYDHSVAAPGPATQRVGFEQSGGSASYNPAEGVPGTGCFKSAAIGPREPSFRASAPSRSGRNGLNALSEKARGIRARSSGR